MQKRLQSHDVERYQPELEGLDALQTLRWVERTIDRPRFASSLGQEDQVILHLIATHHLAIPVFTLDTGRLFPETYDLIVESERRLGLRIHVQFPDAGEVEEMVAQEGINLFRRSVELRRRCCAVRKVHPLRRALRDAGGWVCGLRQEQSPTRTALRTLEWDEAHGIPKISPLRNWSLAQVTDYLQQHDLPYNPLHDRGFVSIGCACCTRAVQPGEDLRAGRWWWEAPEHKECGLHLVDGKLVRNTPLETPHA